MTINLISTEFSKHHSQVEWDELSKIIAHFAYFESTKTRLTAELFVDRRDELSVQLVKTQSYVQEFKDEYRQVLNQLFRKLPYDDSLRTFIGRVTKGGVLNFSELNKVALLIESAAFIKQDFPSLKVSELQTLNAVDFNPFQRKFLREFRHLVDEGGSVHYDRHPELAELSRRLRELEERIRKTVQEWINNPQNQKTLQFNSYDVHYDRFVVPVRSDSYRSDIGLIVSRSESGQTLYVEPYEVRDACNRRLELMASIDELINKLSMKFSQALADFSDVLQSLLQQFLTLDFFLAKSDFALTYHLECPSVRSSPGFKFTGLFHPLLKNAIKNSADCHSSHRGIVISGPNTGGKTVFLKSIALSYLLFYHGFFVPAAEAELYPYEGLFYFGNDLQDLQTGLSSFSGEVKNYIDLMENLLPSNLILIDEIFNSTSSDEASALSMAYFDELQKQAVCHIVVSTHHQMFKTLIHQDRSFVSCHVGFDTQKMRPTYKVQWGTPGASMAIDIFRILARGHDLVSDVPDQALARMSTKNVSYETLLQKVSQKQIELDGILNSNRQLEIELKNQKGAMEGVLNLKLREELEKARREVDKILDEARHIVDEARRNEITKMKKLDEKSHQVKTKIDRLKGDMPEEETTFARGNLDIQTVRVGDIVYSNVFKKDFTVQSVDLRKNELTIGKGPIKFTVPAHSLSFSKKSSQNHKVSVSFQKSSHSPVELDVRGMRLSDCENLVEKGLGDLMSGDIPFLNVIHGHGDGILKNWLRAYLKKSKEFKFEASETGNDGETKIGLR